MAYSKGLGRLFQLGKRIGLRFVPSCVWLFCDPQAPLSMGCCRQKEYWTGLPFPPPRTLPNPGIKPTSVSPALQEDSLPAKPSDVSFMMLSGTQAPPAPLSLAQHCSFLKSPSEPFWSHPPAGEKPVPKLSRVLCFFQGFFFFGFGFFRFFVGFFFLRYN